MQIVSVEHDLHRTKGVKQRSHRPRTLIRLRAIFPLFVPKTDAERERERHR